MLMQGGEFFPFPLTQRVMQMAYPSPEGTPICKRILNVGVQRLTENADGLKIVPTHSIVVAIGPSDNIEEQTFELYPDAAREIAKHLLEMADAAEKLDAVGRA